MGVTTYGDISPSVAAYKSKQLLSRAIPTLIIEMFGQAHPLPERNTKVMKMTRYNALSATPKYLEEGVTPNSSALTSTDISVVLSQMGDGITVSDVVTDTHQDPVLSEASDILGEQAAQMIETFRFGILKAGTNVSYTNGTARTGITTTINTTFQNRVTRALKRQNARPISRIVRSTPSYDTASVAPSFFALCHPDLEPDIRAMSGFTPAEKYGTVTPYASELGKVNDVRYLTSSIFVPFANAATGVTASNGGVNGTTGATSIALLSTGGTNPDVYPVLYIARDAYGLVPFKGMNAVQLMVTNAKPSDSDPWAQRSHVTWKTMQGAAILNDLFMVRGEVVASA